MGSPPGALHHVNARGACLQRIFRDDSGKKNFLGRVSGLLKNPGIECDAWAVLDNHFHMINVKR
jgi:putative transposase